MNLFTTRRSTLLFFIALILAVLASAAPMRTESLVTPAAAAMTGVMHQQLIPVHAS